MLDHHANTEARSNPTVVASTDLAKAPASEQVPARTIRYMDDADFRACLEKVMTTHHRLLSKLAE